MAVPNYFGSDVSNSITKSAMEAVRIRSDIEKMFPRALTEHLAAAAEEQFDAVSRRNLTESLASAAALRLERQFTAATGSLSSSITAAIQKQLDLMEGGEAWQSSIAAAAAAQSAKMARASLMPDLTGLQEASRAMERRMNLEASITADWMRLTEVAARPYRNIADAIGAHLATEEFARNLGGSWHDAFGTDFAIQVREAFEEQVAEEPEQSVFANILVALAALFARYGIKVEPYWFSGIAIGLMASVTFYAIAESARADDAFQTAEVNWHDNRQQHYQTMMIEAFATKEIVHRTRMWSRPDSGSKVLGRVAQGALVIPRMRKGKWTQVGIRADDSPTGNATTGWMLNKYVK